MSAPATGTTSARLPSPRGPLSEAVIAALGSAPPAPPLPEPDGADPFGEDVALALHTCYELHYRGFRGVAPDWEWNAGLLHWRASLEHLFHDALRAHVAGGDDVAGELDGLLTEVVPGDGVSHHLRDHGTWEQMREYFAHRSIYHLKEADPHAWVIPRLQGRAKAALVAVEFDEFGGGRGEDVHAQLFADLLDAAEMDSGYLRYLDVVPAPQLAIVNLMSMLGLHRSSRGALVGHFAAAEISTAPSAQRLATALERLDAPAPCLRFFTEHIEADAVHEQIMRHDVVGDLLDREPELAGDVVFGVQATEFLEGALAERLLGSWRAEVSSLRRPLDQPTVR
ncbi:iron-containing redox enzyme family protein [Saccharopolyspora sp. 6V]|uniref:iron-containing redox enzyme family protein n=1 Tax=Saccharopolyspora sp. 6V TaxID=2877239 RepID=UPI001CD24980|nr:iron-containing redox enzyme family protein [Saccharopolyspora sp. 6V]MCA1192154.1 iron-containing redox enzyme family protein [Saccharopolyspora sp. 6V]